MITKGRSSPGGRLLNSIAIFVLWAVTLAQGQGWERGLFVYQNGNIPVFHLAAECVMACVTLLGLIAWLRRRSWGPSTALIGAGMFGYSAINSLGWALHNQVALALPMLLSLAALPPLFRLARASR